MSNQDEKKGAANDEQHGQPLDSFTERRNRLYTAIGEVVLPGPDTPKELGLEYLCCGVAAQFLALKGSAYAFKMCKLISEDDGDTVARALELAEDTFRSAVMAAHIQAQEPDQSADSKSPTVY